MLASKVFIRTLDVAFMVVLVIAGFDLTHDLISTTNLEFGDEGLYVRNGIRIFNHPPMLDWGTLYSLWYKILSVFEPDKVKLYFLNHRILAILAPILLYLAFRLSKISAAIAFYFALIFLTAELNEPTGVKVSLFAMMLVTITVIITKLRHQNLYQASVSFFVLSLFLHYVRPENTIFTALIFGLQMIWAFQKRMSWKIIAFELAAVLIVWTCIGKPIQGKAELSFKLDYSLNLWEAEPETVGNLNGWQDYEQIVAREFGPNIHSFVDAAQSNPQRLWDIHFKRNFIGIFKSILKVGKDYARGFRSLDSVPHKRYIFPLIFVWLIFIFRKTKIPKSHLISVLEENNVLILLICAFGGVVAGALYSSGNKFRYFPQLYLMFGLIFGISYQIIRSQRAKFSLNIVAMLAAGFLLFSFVNRPKAIKKMQAGQTEIAYYGRLKAKLEKCGHLKTFEHTDKLNEFIDWDFAYPLQYDKKRPFEVFLKTEGVNFLYMSPYMIDYYKKTDPKIGHFLNHIPKDWVRQANGPTGDLIYVHKSLLCQP